MNSTSVMSQAPTASRLYDADMLQWLDGLQESYGAGCNQSMMMTSMTQSCNPARLQPPAGINACNYNNINGLLGMPNYNVSNNFSNQLFQDVNCANSSGRDFMEAAAAAEQMTSGSCSNEDLNTISCNEDLQSCNWSTSKRRKLNEAQARLLERCFEADQRLDAQRKEALAAEVGLDERQVAVWFQNRRARSKSKQLQRDFYTLRDNYDSLTAQCQQLRQEIAQLTEQLEVAYQQQPSTISSTPSPNTMMSPHDAPAVVQLSCKHHDLSSCSSSSSLLQNKIL